MVTIQASKSLEVVLSGMTNRQGSTEEKLPNRPQGDCTFTQRPIREQELAQGVVHSSGPRGKPSMS